MRAEGGARLQSTPCGPTRAAGSGDVRADRLNPTLRVEARSDAGERSLIDSAVPVVPGGFHVQASGATARVEILRGSPRRNVLHVVTDRQRVAGGVIELTPDGRGGSVGTIAVPESPRPAWIVVSSDVDQNSATTIGRLLEVGPEPAQTFDVPDALLLDGLPSAFAREQLRRSRVRWLSAAFIGIALALSVVLLVLRVRAGIATLDPLE